MNTATTPARPAIEQAIYDSGYAMTSRETHIAKHFWNVGINQFLSAGPVSEDTVNTAMLRCYGTNISGQFLRNMAKKLNALLLARHANPVQAEGGEWEELTGEEALKSGWKRSECEIKLIEGWRKCLVTEEDTKSNSDFALSMPYRRRIPTVQPAVAEAEPEVVVIGITPDVRNAMLGSAKWMERIHHRKEMLPALFLDGQDPLPIARALRDALRLVPADKPTAAQRVNALLAGRHANPVQTEGGWEHASGIVAIQRGWRISQCDLVEKNHYVAQHVSNVFEALKTYRRRLIPTQPAVAEAEPECPDVMGVGMRLGEEKPTAAQEQGGTPNDAPILVKMLQSRCADYDKMLGDTCRELREANANLTAYQARVASLEQQCKKHKDNFKKMDSIIDELGVANSCINPFEDLRIAITKLKTERDSLRADLEAMKGRAEKAEEDRAINEKHWGEQLTTQSAELSKEIERLKKEVENEISSGNQRAFDACELRNKALAEVETWKNENESRAQWIASMNKILGYDNSDGFHSSPSPHEIAEQLRNRGGVWRILERNESIREGDYYVPGCGGLVKADKPHWGRQCCEWQVAFMRLESPWHTIIAGDPASLPQIGDADKEGYVFWKWSGLNTNVSSQWDVRYPNPPDYWMPIPPLPTPKASEEDEEAKICGAYMMREFPELAGSGNTEYYRMVKVWHDARASQAVEGKAL